LSTKVEGRTLILGQTVSRNKRTVVVETLATRYTQPLRAFFPEKVPLAMHCRVETNLFFEQAIYLVLFASNAGGV
jgi:hypothetical protein